MKNGLERLIRPMMPQVSVRGAGSCTAMPWNRIKGDGKAWSGRNPVLYVFLLPSKKSLNPTESYKKMMEYLTIHFNLDIRLLCRSTIQLA